MKLIGNIDFSNSGDYQAIYSSQLYGTFFMIYAKISLDEDKTTEKEYHLKTIHLKILNYKGLINLGIVDAVFSKSIDGGSILVEVQGLNSNSEKPVDCSLIHAPFSRDIANKVYLHVQRRTRKLHEEHGGVDLKNGIYDEEYFYREGFKLEKNPKTELVEIIQDQDERIVKPLLKSEVSTKAGGTRCPTSMNAVR